MAKKFGKLFMVAAALGAVAGGMYYYLKDRDALIDDDFDDDDFDNFDEEPEEKEADRNYVDLDLGKKEEEAGEADETAEALEESKEEAREEFKEGIQGLKAEATDKIVGSNVKDVEEFFDDEDGDDSTDAV